MRMNYKRCIPSRILRRLNLQYRQNIFRIKMKINYKYGRIVVYLRFLVYKMKEIDRAKPPLAKKMIMQITFFPPS